MSFFRRKKKEEAAQEAPVVNSARVVQPEPQDDADEIAAVIAAVMELIMAESKAPAAVFAGAPVAPEAIDGFHVRRIKRGQSVSQWGKAGREELLSSKNYN